MSLFSWFFESDRERELQEQYDRSVIRLEDHLRAAAFAKAKKLDLAQGCVLELWQDAGKEWRWRLKARNHKIIAESGEGYKKIQGLHKSLDLVKDIIDVVEEKEV